VASARACIASTGGTSLKNRTLTGIVRVTLEAARSTVTGVSMVHSVGDAADLTHRGLFITTAGVWSKSTAFVLELPAGFVPDTPLGLRWGAQRWRWLDGP
jgi:hypothetical protein